MRFSLTVLTTLANVAFAAVNQQCMGFETPRSGYNTYLQLLNSARDTSVLMYHISDIADTNIPLVVTDETLAFEQNGFAICTQKRLSQGLCEGKELGQFIFSHDNNVQDKFINRYVEPGVNVKYDVQRSGIYCAVVYQDGVPEVEGVSFVQSHWYGYMSLAHWESLKILFSLSVLIFISIISLNIMFRGSSKGCIGTLLDDVRLMFSLQNFNVLIKSFAFQSLYGKVEHHFTVINPFTLADQLYLVTSFVLFYKLSIGVFGITKEKIQSINIETQFKVLLRLYAIASLILVFDPLLSTIDIIFPFTLSSVLIVGFAWIPMMFIMWRNAKATEREMVDPVFSRNYSISRKALVWIPAALGTVSFFGQVAVEMNSNTGFSVSAPPSNAFESAFTHSLEASISQNFWFVLLKHLPDFSMLVTQWTIIFIWRPQMLERTEDIHSNELSDAPHAALKLSDEDSGTTV